MIKLPKFDNQSMYDYETNFHLTMDEERISKFLTHYEAFKISSQIPKRFWKLSSKWFWICNRWT